MIQETENAFKVVTKKDKVKCVFSTNLLDFSFQLLIPRVQWSLKKTPSSHSPYPFTQLYLQATPPTNPYLRRNLKHHKPRYWMNLTSSSSYTGISLGLGVQRGREESSSIRKPSNCDYRMHLPTAHSTVLVITTPALALLLVS